MGREEGTRHLALGIRGKGTEARRGEGIGTRTPGPRQSEGAQAATLNDERVWDKVEPTMREIAVMLVGWTRLRTTR